MKDFDRVADNEITQAYQTIVKTVISEDPRFAEKQAKSIQEEFPLGCKVFFLGEHGYGVAAQINGNVGSLTIMLAVCRLHSRAVLTLNGASPVLSFGE